MMQKCTVILEILMILIVFVDWTEKWQVKLNTDKCKVKVKWAVIVHTRYIPGVATPGSGENR